MLLLRPLLELCSEFPGAVNGLDQLPGLHLAGLRLNSSLSIAQAHFDRDYTRDLFQYRLDPSRASPSSHPFDSQDKRLMIHAR